MIRQTAVVAAVFFALATGGCLTGPQPVATPVAISPIDGNWMSGNRASITTFTGGRLVTTRAGSNEVLAEGSFDFQGGTATMAWIALRTQQNRSATCQLTQPDLLDCQPAGGEGFVLNRV